MLWKLIDGLFIISLLSTGGILTVIFLSFIFEIVLYAIEKFEEFKKRKVGLNAWKVEPELIDRFLNVLADNDYKWFGGQKANELKNWDDDDVVLIIEIPPKRLGFMHYSLHPTKSQENLNIIEVTEELLEDMENEGIVSMEGEGVWKH